MDAHHGAPSTGQQIVHVRGDSQTDLEALFNAVMNPNKTTRPPSSLPMRMRKLPDSFFRQPDPRGHSRQASSDGGVCGSLTPHHVRAHSSPASLPINSLSTQATGLPSAPVIPDDMPLPPGWEMAKTPTGQRYFLNHLDQSTTWHDPRLAQLQPQRTLLAHGVTTHTHNSEADSAQKVSPGLAAMATQQRQEKERLRSKQDLGGRNLSSVLIGHDRNVANQNPSLDARILGPAHEPVLNGAHSRDQSTDSGLSVSSLPRPSDHMLSSMDHMDTGDPTETSSLTLQDTMSGLPMSDTEELMPCIPEGLTSDLLMDMETVLSSSHMDKDSLLTWL
ncbi:transcriptional coactivator YAP1-like isoform X2 [Gadus macrocephalus]|uniref:transcriptional coactivator YAP1-like isoform X2 n=1 Tax=Gadus macrocephalus TaxID=80720 RepID=UPI0028CBBEB5|nr:transcriptional coactivator YAP1-like isoform X2 [Gadus macrocephalus]